MKIVTRGTRPVLHACPWLATLHLVLRLITTTRNRTRAVISIALVRRSLYGRIFPRFWPAARGLKADASRRGLTYLRPYACYKLWVLHGRHTPALQKSPES